MRSITSRATFVFSLSLVLLLSVASPVAASPRESDEFRWERPSFTRIVKLIKKVFTPASDDDAAIPPRP